MKLITRKEQKEEKKAIDSSSSSSNKRIAEVVITSPVLPKQYNRYRGANDCCVGRSREEWAGSGVGGGGGPSHTHPSPAARLAPAVPPERL